MPADKIDTWIKASLHWNSFVDIGGIGEDSCNERVTAAREAGGKRIAMADFEPFSHHLWVTFRHKMKERGVAGVEEHENIDIRNEQLLSKLGPFDFVHSTGINYHLPDPVLGIHNLSKITGRYLVTNTIILPDVIENEFGRIEMAGSRVMFLPAVTENEREILRAYYKGKFGWEFNNNAPLLNDKNAIMPYITDKGLSCYPYWWLFSAEAFRALLRRFGFKIVDEYLWENHTLALLCERAPE